MRLTPPLPSAGLPLLLCAAIPLAAQTEPTAADAAVPPHILIDTVGPEGWRMRFAPTNLGSLLESEQGRELWEPALQPFFGMWQQIAGDEGAYAASRSRLLGYGGRVRMGIWLDPDRTRRGNEPAGCIAAVLDGDGSSDLDAIAQDLRGVLYGALAGEWRQLEADGTEFEVRCTSDVQVTAPWRDGDRLLIALSSEDHLTRAVRRARAMAGAATGELRPDSPAFRVRFEFARILAEAIANEPESDRRMMQLLGLDTVGDGTATLSTAGPRVQLEYAQQFTRQDRGLFSAFLPATQKIPSLLLATGKGSWTVGHFDCLKLYDTILDAIEQGGNGPEDARAEIRTEMGIDPATELLNHMTDEILFWLPDAESFDERFDRADWAATFRLRDEQGFRDGLFKMLPQARPFLQREREAEFEGVEMYRYGNMLGYDLWLAVGRGVFVLAGGRHAEDRVREVLTRCQDLPAELPADGSPPAGFEPLARHLPPGCHGFALGSATNIISLPTSVWLEILGEFGPTPGAGLDLDPEADYDRRMALRELLKEHRLDIARSATGYADDTWRMRVYW